MRRWRDDYGVSLRVPNARFKVSHGVFQERLRIAWLNVIGVRELCLLEFGYDPIVEGADQKPMHFNESGSKAAPPLHFKGTRSVPLRENTAETRERFTVFTYVTSSPDRFVSGLPCEVCFQGGLQIRAEV